MGEMADYLARRRSIRAFKSTPVPSDAIERVLQAGLQSPSWSNTQPYRIAVATGALRDRLAADLCARFDRGQALLAMPAWRRALSAWLGGGAPDSDVPHPHQFPEPLRQRRVATGYGLYGALGIDRRDHAARTAQMRRNFLFFDAPVALFLFTHRALGPYGLLDGGVFLQSLMLAALDEGLGTCAQAALSVWRTPIAQAFQVPDDYALVCGVALGYPDDDAPVNDFRPGRIGRDDLIIPPR